MRAVSGARGAAGLALLALLAFPGVASADLTATEGQSFSGSVSPSGGCAFSGATVTWGDGGPTSDAGQSQDGMTFTGTHTYAEEGTYDGHVTYSCGVIADQTQAFTATVQDASLGSTGSNSSGTANQQLSAVVAHVSDANPAAGASELSASIAWGDGTTSAGTLAAAAAGGFDVTGSHTYSTAGSYAVSTTVSDIGGATTTAGSTAQIAAPPPPGPPVARFTYSPTRPCSSDKVSFDASSSSGGEQLTTDYQWILAFTSGRPPIVLNEARPREIQFSSFVADYEEVVGTQAPNYHGYAAWHVTIKHFPVTVTLQIIPRHGPMDTVTHVIFFRDELVNAVVAYKNNGNHPGAPNSTEPLGIVKSDSECDSGSLLPSSGLAALRLRPTQLSAAAGHLQEKGQDASVAVRLPCLYARLGCDGVLEVDSVGPGRTRRNLPTHRLGVAGFAIRAGHSSGVVRVRLNAYGRSLAIAHKLGRVRLQLVSSGANGRISVTSRTIIIVGGRTGRP